MDFILFFIGGIFLFIGGESLVKGAASIALRIGLSPLVVGLTIVSVATSTPELIVSIQASLAGKGDIALGNVLGSNIANIGLIVGATALIQPIIVHQRLLRIDTWIMLSATFLLIALILFGKISFWFGLIFLICAAIYAILPIYLRSKEPIDKDQIHLTSSVWVDFILLGGGLVALIFGGNLFLKGSISIAQIFGISDAVIGLSLVALGTSLPELATSVVAAYRKHQDMALGNAIGSNIFNIFGVIGATSLINPIKVQGILPIDCFIVLLFTVALIIQMFTRKKISRPEGLVLMISYFTYIFYLYTTQ